ncbi:hypothetical protein K227x_63340 [Rubripirellula lacrimiformis]|uniref:Uncharacterized protein n=1 Tax=Rubripirellula lacrimiformis TaxID=1930273 RepID=A0A517NL89_9BACT|nr:DUF6580 family putative transport protein [Rubripirellula lacrimiformis]QDT07905.1 hypothetical protein K227x_63340 [Rubripirellula lacrimiformis]
MMFYALTLIVAASRFLPHPPNVACVGALGLFAGCYLAGRRAYLVPVTVLLISDVIGQAMGIPGMGFHSPYTMAAVYLGATLAVPVGRYLGTASRLAGSAASGPVGQTKKGLRIFSGSLVASTLFFLVSNFGVWMAGWYSMTMAGLAACYVAAIPFFGYTIAGDLAFTAILFGAWSYSHQPVVARRLALATQRSTPIS